MKLPRLAARNPIAATLLMALPLVAVAQPAEHPTTPEPEPASHGPMHGGRGMGPMDGSPHCDHMGGHHQHGSMGAGHGGHDGGPPTLAGVNLTEAQQDQLFALHQATEAAMRERMKAVKKSAEALRQLSESDRFDAREARKLADQHGQALAQVAYLHAETRAKMLALLTPEQRRQAEEARRKTEEDSRGRPDEP